MPRPYLELRQACMSGRGMQRLPVALVASFVHIILEDSCQRGCPMQHAEMDLAGFFRRIPLLPHQMQARLTPTADMIVLCHLGVPRLDAAQWSLIIDGLVERPIRLGFSELTAYPKHTVESFHQCAGSPLQPFEPTRRICNVRWGGTRLADVLRD